MFRILIFSLVLFRIHAELTIRPSETSLTRDQYKSFIALCTDQSDSQVIGWRSPQGKDIPQNENDRVTVESQKSGLRLRIRNLTTDDQGTWECTGMDSKGQQMRKSFQLTIKVPIIFHGHSIQYVALDQSAVIKCRVQANPVAEVSWFTGFQKETIENPNYELVPDGLRINHVKMSDNETFWCRADVLETGESRDFPITVIVSKSISQARVVCASPCAIEKKTATLTCEATGLPAPKYLWFYGSDSPVSVSEVPKFVVRGNQLTINYIDDTDNGKYSCHAFNEFDHKGQRAEYNLNVIVPPRLFPISPIEINFDVQRPQRVSFPCRVERGSSDGLTLEWQYLNNTPIQPSHGISIDRSQYETNKLIELRFDPVRRENFGNYSCFAKNLADSSYAVANLLIQFQPIYVGANVNVISSIPNYRTTMRCQFQSYPSPQIQWIKMNRTVQDPEGRILAADIDNDVNDITIKQLGPVLYESVLSYTPTERDFGLSFECRALNPRIGRHSFTLQRAAPPKAVNVNRTQPFATGVELSIQSSEKSYDLPIVQYIVKYDLQANKDSQLQTSIIPAQQSSEQVVRIENLRPSTDYQLKIVAESRAGISQPTGPILFRTLDRQIPEFTVDNSSNRSCSQDDSCLITWKIHSDGGAPILRTEILYAQAKDESGLDIKGPLSPAIMTDSSTTEFELTGLTSDMSYVVVVRLFNAAGGAEEKFRIKTNVEGHDTNNMRNDALVTDDRKSPPSKWAIIGIVITVLLSAIVIATVYIALRVLRLNGKHESINSDHQSTPMMNGEHHSDKSNGHSSPTKLGDLV